MKKKNDEITIKEIADLFLPKVWIILLVSVIFAAAAFVYSAFVQEDKYTSSAIVYIYSESNQGNTTNELTAAVSMADVYKEMLTTKTYLKHVVKALPEGHAGRSLSPSQLKGMINVQQIEATQMLRVSVTGTNKELVYDIACKVVDLAPGRLEEIVPNALSLSIVEYPEIAPGANSKHIFRNSMIAFLVGIIITMIAIWIRSLFDVVIHDEKEIEASIDVPVIAVIPMHEVPVSERSVSNELS